MSNSADGSPLGDATQIGAVIARYARTIDERNLDGILSCFTPDANLALDAGNVTAVGHAEIRATYEGAFADSERLRPPAASTHLMGTPELSGHDDGGVAAITTAVAFLSAPDGFYTRGLTYIDRFVRYGDEWLIADRRHECHWQHISPPN